MRVVADLQVHSRYARAVSRDMNIEVMAKWAKKKGIDLVATGDWTHPAWFGELRAELKEAGEGVYAFGKDAARFLLATEVSSIFSQGGRVRRVHTLMWAPDFGAAEKINRELVRRGCNLGSDGRPVVGLSCRQLAEVILGVDERCILIPAHAWTPWFSVYGSSGGFDSIEEAFGEYAKRIYAVETGLSSDPAMNWRIRELEGRAIVSFSDAHSPRKLGREATVFELTDLSYSALGRAIRDKEEGNKIVYTVEFFPEEGKYHYTGHRNCGVVQTVEETKRRGMTCPVCGRPLTVGVMHRVEQLAGRERIMPTEEMDDNGVKWLRHPIDAGRPKYVRLVPLNEILAEVFGVGTGSKKVGEAYERLVGELGSELAVLLNAPVGAIGKFGGERLAEAVARVRRGDIYVKPGYDGVYGEVKIWGEDGKGGTQQQGLF